MDLDGLLRRSYRLLRRSCRIVRDRQLSPRHFRLVTLAAVWAMVLVIVSGATVRLTGSGLGCADWPNCTATHVVAPLQFHAWVEFGNRLINAIITIACVGAVVAAHIRAPRRRDLVLLSWGLLVGLLGEVVLGGLTVEHGLAPGWVTAHFLLAAVFLADAVVLHWRSGLGDGVPRLDRQGAVRRGVVRTAGPAFRRVSSEHLVLGRLLLVAATVVVILGTVVTSTGPHGGDPKAPRFAFSLHDVAQLHGTSVEVFLAFTVLTLWSMARSGAPADVVRRGEVLLVVLVVQGAIGYTQYLLGDPAGVVELHIIGAVALMIAVLRFNLGLTGRPQHKVAAPGTAVTGEGAAAGSAGPEPVGVPVGLAVGEGS